ncbi:helix-turn-helix transcriptional regulator [Streptomyces sp. Tu 3180]|uniref:helix-turn-helix domain-containing protein n=1 Tax=Streptomyces sp. Tu 3180 TaxID=2682611 RepID=UPI00135C8933|nr:helix-turn-helix transcriptional regulator [Streptomyces sp. Tu 3180]KAF3466146.1 helix-turn-helix transcriptional regulator [Streptomyces sp. Tu 3180]
MASLNVGNLGEYLREQRRSAQLSLRQLADAAGVSNPYLSQIERGLRKPSAEVLQQVAKALRISAETLYVRAGILDAERGGEEDRREGATRAVLLSDPTLTERQKQVLLQIYESFRKENGFGGAEGGEATTGTAGAAEVSDAVDGSDRAGDVPDGGAAIRRSRTAGGESAGRHGSTDQGGRPAERRPRRGGGSDTGPRRTAG